MRSFSPGSRSGPPKNSAGPVRRSIVDVDGSREPRLGLGGRRKPDLLGELRLGEEAEDRAHRRSIRSPARHSTSKDTRVSARAARRGSSVARVRQRADVRRHLGDCTESRAVEVAEDRSVPGEREADVRGEPAAGLEQRLERARRTAWSAAPFSAKYQASGGTSYSAVDRRRRPRHSTPVRSTSVTRDMKWYGGPGRRGTRRSPSNGAYIEPKASDGRPQAQARIAAKSPRDVAVCADGCAAARRRRAHCWPSASGQSGTSRRPMRRQWKALSPSTVQSRSA